MCHAAIGPTSLKVSPIYLDEWQSRQGVLAPRRLIRGPQLGQPSGQSLWMASWWSGQKPSELPKAVRVHITEQARWDLLHAETLVMLLVRDVSPDL